MKSIYVGLDVHQDSIAISALDEGAQAPRPCVKIPNDPTLLRRHLGRLLKEGEVRACYEAGPCGYVVHRQLAQMGVKCEVIAPALIPRRPGDRVKTDRRDAEQLAQLYRAGQLTPIRVPNEKEEAARALIRFRDDLRQDLGRDRQRLLKMLQKHGRRFDGGKKHWTQRHWQWLRAQRFDQHYDQTVYLHLVARLEATLEHVQKVDAEIRELATEPEYAPLVDRLRCLKGVDTHTAMGLITEVCDFDRFQRAPEFVGFLGLAPREHSSGATQRRGGITKTGNAAARRLLVESAWHYIHSPKRTKPMQERWAGQPDWVVQHAYRAQERLHHRYRHLVGRRGKKSQLAVVAMARELACFVWAIARTQPQA